MPRASRKKQISFSYREMVSRIWQKKQLLYIKKDMHPIFCQAEDIVLHLANLQVCSQKKKYMAEINIFAHNRSGLLADISKALTERNIDIQTMNTRTNKQGIATLSTSFEISSREELNQIVAKLRNIESVIDIERTTG